MKRFKINWSEVVDYEIEIEAETEEQANEIWLNGNFKEEINDAEFCEGSLNITELED